MPPQREEDYRRKCKEVGEIAATEAGSGRVLTMRAMEVTSPTGSFKRRKLNSDDDDQLVISNLPAKSASPATSENSDRAPVSRCSRTGSSEFVKHMRSVDPKFESHADRFETEISTLDNCGFSRETTPSGDVFAESDDLESSTATKQSAASRRRKQPEAKMPAAAEIEEFLSAAEKYEQKRFADKYNYDVVKDVPLEGRYQWVRLKP